MSLEELLDIFNAEPTKLTKDELVELGAKIGVKLSKRKKEATMIEEISEALAEKEEDSDEPEVEVKEEAVEKEEEKPAKKESSLIGKTFKKNIPNPLTIRYVSIGEEITIKQSHLEIHDFERIFISQVKKGILEEI